MEMMPPSFLDDETVVVNRRGYGVDCGIDHINLTKTVVGQSKRYTASNKVDWADISKFFLASECLATPPSERFLATLPTTRVTNRASEAMERKHIEHKRFDEATSLVCAPSSIITPRVTFHDLTMRPSQTDAVTAFHASSRAVFTLQAAPGWGKTRVALNLGRETWLRGGSVVYLVNTIDLVAQTRSTFETAGVLVDVVTYQGAHRLEALAKGDLLIADEAHHLDSDRVWNACVHRIGSACRTFKMSGKYDSHTEVDYTVTYDAAIEEGVVADYRVVLQYWTEGVRTRKVAQFVHETPTLGPLVFVFWNSVENATAGHRASCELFDASAVVTGTTPNAERDRIRRLADDGYLRVMHLCGCYNEGISIAAVSTVIFGDPRRSPKNVFQCQARANRLHPTKPFYRVVLPILGDTDLEAVAQYVGALATSDGRVHDAMCRLTDGRTTARVVVHGLCRDDAAYTRIVEYLGTTIRNIIDDKIEALVALNERPSRKSVASVRRGDETVEVKIGLFFNDIRLNWKPDGSPTTRLTDAQKASLATAPWFKGALAGWQKAWDAAATAAFVPTTDEKIKALLAQSDQPKQSDVASVRRGDETVEVKIGAFFNHIRLNWKPDGSPTTRLTDAQKASLATAPWFKGTLAGWRKAWDAAATAAFVPTTDEKIKALLAQNDQPKQSDVASVRRGDEIVEVKIGLFFNNIRLNWKPDGSPKTRLTDAQKASLATAPWFKGALAGWRKAWDAAATAAFVPTIDEKIKALLAQSDKPKQSDVASVRRGDEIVKVKIGAFFNNIRLNWKPDGSPTTRLTDAQKASLATAPWFKGALAGWRKAWMPQ